MILEVHKVLHNTRGTSNKIWGILKENDRTFYSFWGRVGKKLSFQEFPHWGYEQDVAIERKLDKGYRTITKEYLLELQSDFDQQVLAMVLGDQAKEKKDYLSERALERIRTEARNKLDGS